MQKVEGSNPFSRLIENALHVGDLVSALKPETKWNHRHAWRLVAIASNSALH
jgi:hypothetical protein